MEPLFTAEQLAEVRAYHAPGYVHAAVSLVLNPLVMVLLVRFATRPLFALSQRSAARLRDRIPPALTQALSRVWTGPGLLEALCFALLLVGAYEVIGLPAGVYFGYIREHQFGQGRDSFGRFLWDEVKGAAVFGAAVVAVAMGLFGLARKLEAWWWLLGTVASVAMLASSFADPYRSRLYVTQEPLADGPLRTRISALMAEADIDFRDVLVEKISTHTVKLQAYFAGQGGTRTIVLADTLLGALSEAEVVAAVAHEAGHVGESRWLGRVGSVLALLAFLGLVEALFRAAPRRRWFGIGERADVRLLPLIFLVFDLSSMATNPFSGALSRHRESEADAYAVRLTKDPAAFRSMLMKAARINKMDPTPPRWLVLSGMSHPPIAERLAAIPGAVP